MITIEALDRLPLWLVFAGTSVLLLVFHEVGFRFAADRSAGSGSAAQAAAVMSAVLALLSLMLAFTFGMAGTRFDARRQAVIDEVNAIGTTWLRSHFLPATDSDAMKSLLRRYLDVRLQAGMSTTSSELDRAITESEALHEQMWAHAAGLSRKEPQSRPVGLFIESLNELINRHEDRVSFGVRYRIAGGVWLTLYFVALTSSMAAGAHARLTGSRNLRIGVLLAVSLSAAMAVTIDLDRQRQALFSVSQDSLLHLQAEWGNTASAAPGASD